ncbi:hypothetical protein HanXRQr2_Chr10g0456931 [Helianthus annuus]|uniref:Uncharacterized protein n=1 Tax=Helianthus annuus TaxID=4232 RepID=A0A9K3I0P2_HELAN|nr:hypothetical protein HanXRQr2_Chr10g0456931 [Helianthus annuus]KAJ0931480.1 hypothetical protein HanPSC8_Chr04g0162111 [Helianthus annuus]
MKCNAGIAEKSHRGSYDQMESRNVVRDTKDLQGIEIKDRVTRQIVRERWC